MTDKKKMSVFQGSTPTPSMTLAESPPPQIYIYIYIKRNRYTAIYRAKGSVPNEILPFFGELVVNKVAFIFWDSMNNDNLKVIGPHYKISRRPQSRIFLEQQCAWSCKEA